MQHVPALAGVAVAVELDVARDAPDVGADVVLALEHLLRLDDFGQDRAAAEQLRARGAVGRGGGAEPVQPLQDAVADALGHRRHRVLLVHDGQVVEDALLIDVHPADAVLDDDGDLVGERRVVGDDVRHRIGEQMAVAVLVLQPFAGQRRPAGGAAEHEAAGARIGGRPDQVADPLEAEHRIEDEERESC